MGAEPETDSRFERGATLPSLLALESLSRCLRVGVGELLGDRSSQPDDQAARITAWLAGREEDDRQFVLDWLRRACDGLR